MDQDLVEVAGHRRSPVRVCGSGDGSLPGPKGMGHTGAAVVLAMTMGVRSRIEVQDSTNTLALAD